MGGVLYSASPHTMSQATPTFSVSNSTATPTFPTPFTLPPQVDPFTGPQHHNMSPTAFLNMPSHENEPLNIAQLSNFPMKAEPLLEPGSTNPGTGIYPLQNYQQDNSGQRFSSINSNATEDIFSMQSTIQSKVNDMEGAFGVTPPPPHPHSITTSTPGSFQFPNYSQTNQYPTQLSESHMTNSQGHMIEQQHSFVRVSSAGNLDNVTSPLPRPRPPLERGKSEPIKRLREQVQKLNEEQAKQIQEIDKQKNFADRQYTELLQTVLQQLSSGKASDQQKQILQNVLSDPSLVNILRDVLLTTPNPSGQGMDQGSISLAEVHRGTPELTSSPNILSPSDSVSVCVCVCVCVCVYVCACVRTYVRVCVLAYKA